jgi:predicted nucleotidyltransferase
MLTQQDCIRAATEFARRVKQKGIHLRRAILYGSYSRNQQKEHSDIDIALVADEFIGVGFEDVKLFLDTLRDYILIQPKTYSTEDFEKGDPFVKEILRTGIELKI